MATDIQVVKAKLLQERQAAQEVLAAIDVPAEQALWDQSVTTYTAQTAVQRKKQERWEFVQEKQARVAFLDAQLALFG